MADVDDARAVLITGVYGSGKTSVVEEIEERLRPSVTSGRQDDLREAAAWLRTSRGIGIEDVMVQNDGPVREVAEDILRWLGWDQTVDTA